MATERRKKPKGKQTAKGSAQQLAIAQRREEATRLKLAGHSYREIAAQLNCSVGTVHTDIGAVLERAQEKAEDYLERERAISVARLEKAVVAIWQEVELGNFDAVDRLVKLEQRRGKTIGFDAPERRELSGRDGGPIKTQSVADLLALADADD